MLSVVEVYSIFVNCFPNLAISYMDLETNRIEKANYLRPSDIFTLTEDLVYSQVIVVSPLTHVDVETCRAQCQKVILDVYNLFAVIYLSGARSPNQVRKDMEANQTQIPTSGGHYTSYIKMKDGNWYYYDDGGPGYTDAQGKKVSPTPIFRKQNLPDVLAPQDIWVLLPF